MADINAETLLGVLGFERRSPSESVAKVAGALVFGAIIGASTSLLLAPAPGKWRRRGPWDRVDEAKDALVATLRRAPREESVRAPRGAVGPLLMMTFEGAMAH